jgi:hypothetical protein
MSPAFGKQDKAGKSQAAASKLGIHEVEEEDELSRIDDQFYNTTGGKRGSQKRGKEADISESAMGKSFKGDPVLKKQLKDQDSVVKTSQKVISQFVKPSEAQMPSSRRRRNLCWG